MRRNVVLLIVFACTLRAEDAASGSTATLLKLLASDDFDARAKAADDLIKSGLPSRKVLRDAIKKSGDPEQRAALERIIARIEENAVPAERKANCSAYESSYKPLRDGLAKQKKTGWIVIAAGKVLSMDHEGAIQPERSLKDADTLATKLAPDAVHRFVFEVGEDGDQEFDVGGTACPNTLGIGFLAQFSPYTARFGPDEKVVINGKDIGAKGPDECPYTKAQTSAPLNNKGEETLFVVSTGAQGHGMITADLAARLRLSCWEIPGKIKLKGFAQNGDCRRAMVRLRIEKADVDFTTPIAVWLKDGEDF